MLVYQDLSYLKDQNKAKALVEFLQWATHDGQKLAGALDYIEQTGLRGRFFAPTRLTIPQGIAGSAAASSAT